MDNGDVKYSLGLCPLKTDVYDFGLSVIDALGYQEVYGCVL